MAVWIAVISVLITAVSVGVAFASLRTTRAALEMSNRQHIDGYMPLITFERECPEGDGEDVVIEIKNNGVGPALAIFVHWDFTPPGQALDVRRLPDGAAIMRPGDVDRLTFKAEWLEIMIEEFMIGPLDATRVLGRLTVEYKDVFSRQFVTYADLRFDVGPDEMGDCDALVFRNERISLPGGGELRHG